LLRLRGEGDEGQAGHGGGGVLGDGGHRAYVKSVLKGRSEKRVGVRVPGLGQITWRFVLTKKLRGHVGKKIARKSRNICFVNGGGVGA